MIRIFEGVPGSGKTYAMVSYLKKFARFDSFYNEWVLDSNVCVISNIEGLRLPHINFDLLVDELTLKGVFSESFVKSLHERGYTHVIFAIDEAQKYFDTKVLQCLTKYYSSL